MNLAVPAEIANVSPSANAAAMNRASIKTSDVLYYRDRQFDLLDHPLEGYFELIGEAPALDYSKPITAAWAIEDGWLYLTELTATWANGRQLSLTDLFPYAGEKVFAAWYTGTLKATKDEAPAKMLSSSSAKRYPDLVLGVNVGRIRQSSMVHRTNTDASAVSKATNVVAFARQPAEGLPVPTNSAGLAWESKGGSAVYI